MNRPLKILVVIALLAVAPATFAQRLRAVEATPPPPQSAAPTIFGTAPADLALAIAPCMFTLNLSDAQKTQIHDILVAGQTTLQPLQAKVKADHDALLAAASGASPNACSVGSAFLQEQVDLKALQAQLQTIQSQVESVLTSEQKAKLQGCAAALQKLFPPKP